jgi:hypothetical protein
VRPPLRLELLETRDCPAAPTITSFSAQLTSGNKVLLSGTLTDDDPASCNVSFAGLITASTTADASGDFSLLVSDPGPGHVTAQAISIQPTGSQFAADLETDSLAVQATIAIPPPTVILNAGYNADGSVTLAGQVTSESPSGLTVRFSGAVSGSAVTDSNGNFSLTTGNWSPGTVHAQTTDPWGQPSNTPFVTLAPPPVISAFSAQVLNRGTNVLLSGTVTDAQPANCNVSFGGVASGQIYPNPSGQFSLTVAASKLGTITARAENVEGVYSAQAQATISSTAPSLTLTASGQGAGGVITLCGQVTAAGAAGLTVTFRGAVSATAVTDSNGRFSLATTSWSPGAVTAQTTDAWGQTSNTPSATLTNLPPVVSNFTAVANGGGYWTFEGEITDEYAPGETVWLWGLPTLNGTAGHTAVTVGSNGWFSYSVQLTSQDHGTVWAQAFDWQGLASDMATYIV